MKYVAAMEIQTKTTIFIMIFIFCGQAWSIKSDHNDCRLSAMVLTDDLIARGMSNSLALY